MHERISLGEEEVWAQTRESRYRLQQSYPSLKIDQREVDGKKERMRGEAKPSVSSSLPECCSASPGPYALCSVLSNKTPSLMLENSLQAVNHPL